MKPTYVLTFAMLLLFGACSDAPDTSGADSAAGASAETSSSDDADLASIQEYELTMDGMDKYYAAMRSVAIATKDLSPEEREEMEVDLADDNVDGIEGMVDLIEQNEIYREALDDAGLSAEEFALLTMSMLQSSMAAMVIEMQPNADPDSLIQAMEANPDNVAFIRENREALDAKQEAMEAELEAMGITDEE